MDAVESCDFRGTCEVSVGSTKVQDQEDASDVQPDSSNSVKARSRDANDLQPESSDSVRANTEDEMQTQNTVAAPSWDLVMENYSTQQQHWPSEGRHILAHFDDTSVVVYQAFKDSIAEYAVKHQRFGGPHFSLDRMTWIKTNFMWMMYRCGWAQKANQERVLAVRIKRDAFEDILSKALTGQEQKVQKLGKKDITVRLQWDPDHDPKGGCLKRKAIQLGIKGKTLLDYTTTYILNIKDITDFVHEQYHILQTEQGQHAILTPRERVYTPSNSKISEQIGLDFHPEQTVVSFGH
ncbi:hypothetical protein BsWGS_07369 [Bradybaena similaris]